MSRLLQNVGVHFGLALDNPRDGEASIYRELNRSDYKRCRLCAEPQTARFRILRGVGFLQKHSS